MEFVSYLAVVSVDALGNPQLLMRQPQWNRQATPFPTGVTAFAIAANQSQLLTEKTATLTMVDGTRLYVASLTAKGNDGTPRAICALSRRPLLRQLLSALHALMAAAAASAESAVAAIASLLLMPFPIPGTELRANLAGMPLCVQCARIGSPPALGVSLYSFVQHVGVDIATRAIEVLVAELKLVLISRAERALGEASEALMALLHPFQWPHTYIPFLPIAWRGYVEAPCPFIIGITITGHHATSMAVAADGRAQADSAPGESCSDVLATLPSDVCVLDLDACTLRVPADEFIEPLPSAAGDMLGKELGAWLEHVADEVNGGASEASDADGRAKTDAGPDWWSAAPNGQPHLDEGAQKAVVRFWRRLLRGYTRFLIDGGCSVDVKALLAQVPAANRPFLQQLVASAAFLGYLEKVATGETVDEIAITEPESPGNLLANGERSVVAAEVQPAGSSPQLEIWSLPPDVFKVPDGTGPMIDSDGGRVGAGDAWTTLDVSDDTSSSAWTHWPNLEAALAWPEMPNEATDAAAYAATQAVLEAAAAAASASPSSVPLQLVYASELMRADRTMEALGALEVAQQRIRRYRYFPPLAISTPTPRFHSSSSSSAPQRQQRIGEDCDGSIVGDGGFNVMATDELTLGLLLRTCLSRLDRRRVAELATMRTPLPATTPGATGETDAPTPDATSWRQKLSWTLRGGTGFAASPTPTLASTRSTGTPGDGVSPQRTPLLALWARAYLEEQSRAAENDDGDRDQAATTMAAPAASVGQHSGDDDDDDDDDGEKGQSSSSTRGAYRFYGGTNSSLLGPQDGVLSDAPPDGWGLAIPWPWRTGSEASGRRKHVAVDPVQLFEQVSHEVQGELPIGATNLISSSLARPRPNEQYLGPTLRRSAVSFSRWRELQTSPPFGAASWRTKRAARLSLGAQARCPTAA